jgi:TPR repeat protein
MMIAAHPWAHGVLRSQELLPMADPTSTVSSFWDSIQAIDSLNQPEIAAALETAEDYDLGRILSALERTIGGSDRETLLKFGPGRRAVLTALERLAWSEAFFSRSALLLLCLADADNESWLNNASGVWASLFFTYLASTEVPLPTRYRLIELIQANHPVGHRLLAVTGIEAALTISEMWSPLQSNGAVDQLRRWRPANREEDLACRRQALGLLDAALRDPATEVSSAARRVLIKVSRELVAFGLSTEISGRLLQLEYHDLPQRKELWETITELLEFEGQAIPPADRYSLQAKTLELFGHSLHDRLLRYVGRLSSLDWRGMRSDERAGPQQVIEELASEFFAEPDSLREALPWLSSGAAENVWSFGRQLGRLDAGHQWVQEIAGTALAGGDARLFSSYLQGRSEANDAPWVEDLLDEWSRDPTRSEITAEATLRGSLTSRSVRRLVTLSDKGWLKTGKLRALTFGDRISKLEAAQVADLLELLLREDSGIGAETALALLVDWAEAHGHVLPPILKTYAWTFFEKASPLADQPSLAFFWTRLGRMLLQDDAKRIMHIILMSHAERRDILAEDERVLILDALRTDPESAWLLLSERLLEDDKLTFRFQFWAGEAGLLDAIDSQVLMNWARLQPDVRARLLAKLAKPKRELTPLIRALLKECGPEGSVSKILWSNFESGIWSGRTLDREQQQLSIAKLWQSDPEFSVWVWATRGVGWIEQEILGIRNVEKERELREKIANGDRQALVQLGFFLLSQAERMGEAEDIFHEALNVDEGEATLGLAVLRQRQKRPKEAEDLLRRAIALGNRKAVTDLAALLARQDGRDQEAESLFRDALSAGEPSAAFNLATFLHSQQGREAEAEQLYRSAIALGDVKAQSNLGALLADQMGRQSEAEQIYRQALTTSPNAAFNLALILLRQPNRQDEAEKVLHAAALNGDGESAFHLGNLLARQPGRQDEAEAAYREAVSAGHVRAALNLAVLLTGQPNRSDDAIAVSRYAASIGIADAFNNLGVLLAKQGRRDEAEEAFRMALDSGVADADYNMGRLLADQPGRKAEAEHYFSRAIDAGNAKAFNDLALLLLDVPQRENEVERLFEQAISLGDVKAYNNLGLFLTRRRRRPEAEEAFRAAIAAGVVGAKKNLGNLLSEDPNRTREAEELYREAVADGDAGAAFNLGLLARNEKRTAEAEEAFRLAVSMGYPMAYRDLAILLISLKRLTEAEQALREAIDAGISDAYNDLGILMVEQGRNEEAEQAFRLGAVEGAAYAGFNLASLLHQQGRLEEAEPIYRSVIEAGDYDAYNNLGALLAVQAGREREAEAEFRRAAELGVSEAARNLEFLLRSRRTSNYPISPSSRNQSGIDESLRGAFVRLPLRARRSLAAEYSGFEDIVFPHPSPSSNALTVLSA